MTDDPTQAMGPVDEPTTPVDAVGGDSGPPTEAMPALPADGEPPRSNGVRVAIIVVVLLLVALLGYLLLTDDDDDDPAGATTTTSADDTTTTAADSTSTTEPTTTSEATTTTSTSTTTTTEPSIDSLAASDIACPDPLTLTWTSTNAVSVEVAIDNPGGVFDTGPPNGSMEVPAPCGGDTQTYYVTAVSATGDRSTETLVLP